MQLGALVSIYRYKSGENCLNGVRTVDEELGSYRPPVNSNVFKSSNGTQHVYSSNCIDIGLHSSDSFPSKCETTRLAHSEPSSQPCRASTLTLHMFLCIQQSPLFRVSYFVVWTGVFVLFQWIVHACVSFWWPHPFLDLSSPYAPLWYATQTYLSIPYIGYEHQKVEIKLK
ncbi:uncharacterized protein LOC125589082 [Brassica napus]|uniref:uncharacterized protein LOC125589082 n=1 Tax=Brassica napus TaxID=3708 RepID=UPI00207A8365|nr:uncharacterized protein LOC125589082 [Brassica napus]